MLIQVDFWWLMSPSDGLFQPAGGPPLSMTPLGASPHHHLGLWDGFMNGTLGNKIADTSTSPVDLYFPVLNPFQSFDRSYHHWSRSNWISSSIIIRLAGDFTSITCYWGNDWLLKIERIQTQNHQLVYTAPENWLLIHHFGNDWGYIQDDANGLQESPVFFYVERPGRALIFDCNPIPITLYSWWLSHVQSPHYLVGFIGVRLSDSESWTSECPHEGTLCRPESLYIASCVWHVELPNLRTNI